MIECAALLAALSYDRNQFCKYLLRKCQIPFLENEHTNGSCTITIKNRYMPIWLKQFKDKVFGYWLLDESPDLSYDRNHFTSVVKTKRGRLLKGKGFRLRCPAGNLTAAPSIKPHPPGRRQDLVIASQAPSACPPCAIVLQQVYLF